MKWGEGLSRDVQCEPARESKEWWVGQKTVCSDVKLELIFLGLQALITPILISKHQVIAKN